MNNITDENIAKHNYNINALIFNDIINNLGDKYCKGCNKNKNIISFDKYKRNCIDCELKKILNRLDKNIEKHNLLKNKINDDLINLIEK